MRNKPKCRIKSKKNRDCTMCRNFGGFISWNYYICTKYMYKNEEPRDVDIYDRDVLKKGTCAHYEPIEIELFRNMDNHDDLHDHATMECSIEEDDQSIPDEE